MPGNSNLHDSSRNKQDEFYTNLQLIEDELKHYRAHFKGKRVLCNCDDPYESNFFKFFAMSFNSLGLKSLTATCFVTSPVVCTQLDLFGHDTVVVNKKRKGAGRKHQPYKIVVNEVTDVNGDGRIDLADVEWLIKNQKNVLTKLDGDGDFRSPECVALLDEADIVVTNPPFSLFREYMALMMEHEKQFLVSASPQAGWVFNEGYGKRVEVGHNHGDPVYGTRRYTPRETYEITDGLLMSRPFFRDFRDEEMYGEGGSEFVRTNDFARWYALSHGIPAESFAAGANPVPKWDEERNIGSDVEDRDTVVKKVIGNIDMAVQCGRNSSEDTPEDWIHSYFIQFPLYNTSKLYESLVEIINNKPMGVE